MTCVPSPPVCPRHTPDTRQPDTRQKPGNHKARVQLNRNGRRSCLARWARHPLSTWQKGEGFTVCPCHWSVCLPAALLPSRCIRVHHTICSFLYSRYLTPPHCALAPDTRPIPLRLPSHLLLLTLRPRTKPRRRVGIPPYHTKPNSATTLPYLPGCRGDATRKFSQLLRVCGLESSALLPLAGQHAQAALPHALHPHSTLCSRYSAAPARCTRYTKAKGPCILSPSRLLPLCPLPSLMLGAHLAPTRASTGTVHMPQ